MEMEYNSLPKDVNRGTYTKRINEIVSGLKSQNGEIKSILTEIKDIQDETTKLMQDTKKIDAEVEDLVFKDASKDTVAKSIYKEIQDLKGAFDSLVTGV